MDIIYNLLGIIGIGGIIILVVKWFIEKRRIRFKRRIELIDKSRNVINNDNSHRTDFIKTSIYSNLKPHLSTKLKKELESGPNNIYVEVKDDHSLEVRNFKKELHDEIAVLEKKWKLI